MKKKKEKKQTGRKRVINQNNHIQRNSTTKLSNEVGNNNVRGEQPTVKIARQEALAIEPPTFKD